MPRAPLTVPGLAQPLMLPSDLDAKVDLVTSNRFRSYQKFTGQSKTTVHDTGNPNTNALGELQWAKDGRPGGSVGGYNGITDATRVRITAPFDEIIWHAGTPNGNQSYGVEMAFGKSQKYDKVLATTIALHGAIIAAKGLNPNSAAVMHQVWYGKHCPGTILDKGLWDDVRTGIMQTAETILRDSDIPTPTKWATPQTVRSLDQALKAVANPENPALTVAPRSVFDPSSQVRFFWVGDRVKATRQTPRLQYAFTDAERIGPEIEAGTEFDVNWLFVAGDGREYYLTPWGTRVRAEDTVRVSDLKQDD
jgi:hypothetical protein